jgi:pyridoxine 4-dehydrogenase
MARGSWASSTRHPGFGAMRITGQGIWGPPKDESEAIALLRRVVDRGVTFIDTADSYGPGISEPLIAKALYPYPAGLGWWWRRRAG